MQVLYQVEMSGLAPAMAFDLFCAHFEASTKSAPYARELFFGVHEKWDAINARIAGCVENWRTERMSVVDRNILRVAVYEMCFRTDVPARVAINEAIEVAKKYGSEDSGAFINGILDAIRKSHSAGLTIEA